MACVERWGAATRTAKSKVAAGNGRVKPSTAYWDLGQSGERSSCCLQEQGGQRETATLAKAAPFLQRAEERGGAGGSFQMDLKNQDWPCTAARRLDARRGGSELPATARTNCQPCGLLSCPAWVPDPVPWEQRLPTYFPCVEAVAVSTAVNAWGRVSLSTACSRLWGDWTSSTWETSTLQPWLVQILPPPGGPESRVRFQAYLGPSRGAFSRLVEHTKP